MLSISFEVLCIQFILNYFNLSLKWHDRKENDLCVRHESLFRLYLNFMPILKFFRICMLF